MKDLFMKFTTCKLKYLCDITSVKLVLFCPYSHLLYYLSPVLKFGLIQLVSIPSST